MGQKIFVSYSERDTPLVDLALLHLQNRGLLPASAIERVGHQASLSAGDLRGATKQAIESSDVVVVLWTKAAAESKWVNYEIGMADALGKRLVAVAIGDAGVDFPPGIGQSAVVMMPKPRTGSYVLNQSSAGTFFFVLRAESGEVLLRSEQYTSKSAAINGIAAVQANCGKADRLDRRTASNGHFYFTVRAGNHQIIAMSELFPTELAREATLQTVQATGSIATAQDA